ncbi:MAG: hypothetical protein BWX86_00038 [Verrucomicrobia bacterium ADurb.Bin122]|nr:MAG: hypothetical protein BWX86_00038 [Verrucomicrobia bacterium ADurb.Bin122]
MKTLTNMIDEVALESFPGSTFSPAIKTNAVGLLEEMCRKTAVKALRKAILGGRPKTPLVATEARPKDAPCTTPDTARIPAASNSKS